MPTKAEDAQQSQAGLELFVANLVKQRLDSLTKTSKLDPRLVKVLTEQYRQILNTYGPASSVLATRQYMTQRADAGIRDAFKPTAMRAIADMEQRVQWAFFHAAQPGGFDTEMLIQQLAESAAKDVHDAGRDTIITNVKRDRQATAWARIPEPELTKSGTCSFCAMLAGRGAVYKSDTVKFLAHTAKGGKGHSCVCHAEPVFGTYKPSEQVKRYADLWQSAVVDQNRHGADARAAYRQAIEGRDVTGLSRKAGSNTSGPARGVDAPSPDTNHADLQGIDPASVRSQVDALRQVKAALPSGSRVTAAVDERLVRLSSVE